MISFEDISVYFNQGSSLEVLALKNIQLQIRPKTFNMIVGANGSGKSTLLNLLAGTINPTEGSLLLNNRDITKRSVANRSSYIARIFQNPTLGTSPNLSLIENFRLASLRSRKKNPIIGINNAFRKVVASHVSILEMGLEKRLDQPLSSFSGGQRQALSLLMATFDKLDVLLLDEPTAALDPKSAETVINLAFKVVREKELTAIMVTHDLRHCLYPVDRVIQMQGGEIRKDITGRQLEALDLEALKSWF